MIRFIYFLIVSILLSLGCSSFNSIPISFIQSLSFGYEDKKYNLLIVWISLIISLGSIFYIGLTSYRQINNQMKDYNPND